MPQKRWLSSIGTSGECPLADARHRPPNASARTRVHAGRGIEAGWVLGFGESNAGLRCGYLCILFTSFIVKPLFHLSPCCTVPANRGHSERRAGDGEAPGWRRWRRARGSRITARMQRAIPLCGPRFIRREAIADEASPLRAWFDDGLRSGSIGIADTAAAANPRTRSRIPPWPEPRISPADSSGATRRWWGCYPRWRCCWRRSRTGPPSPRRRRPKAPQAPRRSHLTGTPHPPSPTTSPPMSSSARSSRPRTTPSGLSSASPSPRCGTSTSPCAAPATSRSKRPANSSRTRRRSGSPTTSRSSRSPPRSPPPPSSRHESRCPPTPPSRPTTAP